ncbi:HNH endonuclease [Exiguobacterium indicum]|uniref:HNH endonuclease n=1 Tax=Exiguobacterium indicum TaxID=296995 RepID=A0A0V8GI03_9BACL|nr:HNH endonuclease [Exiguobacterium enclense]KSU49929.1 HNH endonuclease [Exiguobacterium enclense]SDB86503.1 HNH endonuclease [Exiguobacterium enclense]
MATWLEDIITALKNLNGISHYKPLYEEISRIREQPLSAEWKSTVRNTIETHSQDSKNFTNKSNIFYSVNGLSSGVWGLVDYANENLVAVDAGDIDDTKTIRNNITISRIVRDTKMTGKIKSLHNYSCQICKEQLELADGKYYSEAHHIKPLGNPHNGPDTADNIIIVCPNHHALLDYGAIELEESSLSQVEGHKISSAYIQYHNTHIQKKSFESSLN